MATSSILRPIAAVADGDSSNLFNISAVVSGTFDGSACVGLALDIAGARWAVTGGAWLSPDLSASDIREAFFGWSGWAASECLNSPGRKAPATKVIDRARAAFEADFNARPSAWVESVRGAVHDALALAGAPAPAGDAESAAALVAALAEADALRIERDQLRAAGAGPDVAALLARVEAAEARAAAAEAEAAALRPAAPVRHEVFGDVLAALDCETVDAVWLYGPAGTGKTALCEQVAEARGWGYHMVGCVSDVFAELKGFVDANGGRNVTEFVRALDEAAGGRDVLMVFDEIDASIAAVLNSLNGVLSGAAIECAGRVYSRADLAGRLHVAACANTLGLGGDDMYQRERIDAATLDRFALVEVDYSPAIDAACAGGDPELLAFAQAVRAAFVSLGLDALMSYRGIRKLAGLGEALGKVKACRMAFACRLSPSDLDSLIAAVRSELRGNSWFDALAELRAAL